MNGLSKNRIREISKGSLFNFKENVMLYLSEKMPYPNTNDDNYITKISDEVYKLIKASNGHALVLFTSYKPLRMVYKDLKDRILDIPLIEMSRGKKSAVTEFRNSENGVIFATGSMWEGVNLPGDILSHLIIVKLAFPIPDPIGEYDRTLYKDTNNYMQSIFKTKER